MNKQLLKEVIRYSNLPETPEKAEINRKYLNDEIDSWEFYDEVREYLEKLEENS